MAGRKAWEARGQCQEARGPGHGEQPALFQQPQNAGGGKGLGGGRGCSLLQVSALVLLLLGAAILEPDLHLGAEGTQGFQKGKGKDRRQSQEKWRGSSEGVVGVKGHKWGGGEQGEKEEQIVSVTSQPPVLRT